MRELWRRIKEIFNAGQEEYKLCEGSHGDDMDLYRCFKIGTDNSGTSFVCTIDSSLALIGFLLSREYGFAEAWAKGRYPKFDVMGISNSAEVFIQRLALVVDKDEWLEENL